MHLKHFLIKEIEIQNVWIWNVVECVLLKPNHWLGEFVALHESVQWKKNVNVIWTTSDDLE